MSSSVQATLARLAKANAGNKKAAATGEKTPFFKMKEGKNNIMILEVPFSEDPFMPWAGHKNLLDQEWMEIHCDLHNHNKECIVCDVVDSLKKQDWKGNMPLWKPIEQKIKHFSWVIDLDDTDKGPQLWSYGKSVSSQFETWLANLEEEETPFYLKDNPEKIVVTFDKNKTAMEMYKLDKKVLKPFAASQYEDWQSKTKSLPDIFDRYAKSQEDISELVDRYTLRMQEEIANMEAKGDTTPLAQKPETLKKLKD
jgi:hypothetical protein